jgi:Uma2 family endonuclease
MASMPTPASLVLPETPGVELRVHPVLRLTDEELFELCALNRELHIERTAEGNLEIMSPAGAESSHRNVKIVVALARWSEEDGTGFVTDSSGGFLLPNGAMRAPDAAWVRRERLSTVSAEQRRKFLPLVPDFVVELRSPSDVLSALHRKMEEYRDQGAVLGWLIDPLERQVTVYRPGRPVATLEDPVEIHGDPELPRFVLSLPEIWQSL